MNPAGAVAASIWSAAARLAAPPLRLMLARRVRAGKEIAARLPERRGIDATPRPDGRLLWMHAASVGEALSVLPVLAALARRAPDVRLLLTTGTVSSARLAAERLPAGALHRFVPLDVPRWIGRFLDHWRPDLACFVESEIWPNTLAATRRRGIPLVLLNARLSARSFRNWQRGAALARRLFGVFDVIWARSSDDAGRLRHLAGKPVMSPGDLKFAADPLPVDQAELEAGRVAVAGRRVLLAASLHPGEETIVIAAHALLAADHPGLLTIIVPRHPERGAAIAAAHPMPRRAAGDALPQGGPYLADTLGELGLFYRLATCAFIGGSLVPHGGQNPLEAARLGLPVAMGPHAENFHDACAVLTEAGVLTRVADAPSLAAWATQVLADPPDRGAGIAAASRWVDLPDRSARMLLDTMRR